MLHQHHRLDLRAIKRLPRNKRLEYLCCLARGDAQLWLCEPCRAVHRVTEADLDRVVRGPQLCIPHHHVQLALKYSRAGGEDAAQQLRLQRLLAPHHCARWTDGDWIDDAAEPLSPRFSAWPKVVGGLFLLKAEWSAARSRPDAPVPREGLGSLSVCAHQRVAGGAWAAGRTGPTSRWPGRSAGRSRRPAAPRPARRATSARRTWPSRRRPSTPRGAPRSTAAPATSTAARAASATCTRPAPSFGDPAALRHGGGGGDGAGAVAALAERADDGSEGEGGRSRAAWWASCRRVGWRAGGRVRVDGLMMVEHGWCGCLCTVELMSTCRPLSPPVVPSAQPRPTAAFSDRRSACSQLRD